MSEKINLIKGVTRTAVTIASLDHTLVTLRPVLEVKKKLMETSDVFLLKGIGAIPREEEAAYTIKDACKSEKDKYSSEVVRILTIQAKSAPVVPPATVILIAKGRKENWRPYPISEPELQSTLSQFRSTLMSKAMMTAEDDFVVKDAPVQRPMESAFKVKEALDKDQHLNVAPHKAVSDDDPWG
jgi:hypothetical protein